MTKKDMELMAEAYEQIEEGLFSRAKARVAGVAGSAKDAIQRGRGQVQKVAGRVAAAAGATNVGAEIQDAGQAKVDAGQGGGDAAKKASITASIINGVIADLTKLGLDGDPEVVNNIKRELTAVFDLYLTPPFEADPSGSEFN
tara:strand:+ start:454 stop:882 length:429 start_codon:yes stop_codon:yes gene_type:complete